MSLADLRDLGLGDILTRAADLIQRHGHCKGVHRNPRNGSLDLLGAVAVACGAPNRRAVLDPETAVPPANRGRYEAAAELLEHILGCDPQEWNDQVAVDRDQAIAVLRQAGDRILIAAG